MCIYYKCNKCKVSASKSRTCRATQPGPRSKNQPMARRGAKVVALAPTWLYNALSQNSITRMQQLLSGWKLHVRCINCLQIFSDFLRSEFFLDCKKIIAICLNLSEAQEKWHRKTGGPSVISTSFFHYPVPFLQFSVSCRDQELAATSSTSPARPLKPLVTRRSGGVRFIPVELPFGPPGQGLMSPVIRALIHVKKKQTRKSIDNG